MARDDEQEIEKGAVVTRNFTGMNNITPEDRLGFEKLRAAVNVDFNKEGRVTRRTGQRAVLNGQLQRGLWSPDGREVYYADFNRLMHFTAGVETPTVVFTGLHLGGTPAFAKPTLDIYFSDGLKNRILKSDGSIVPWGIDAPLAVAASYVAGGALEKGTYLVTATCFAASGEESGAFPVQKIVVPVNGGSIRLSGLVAPADPRVVGFNLYVSSANGEVLYKAKQVLRPALSGLITTLQTQAGDLRTEHLTPPPPATKLCVYRGRIFGMVGNLLWWTESLRYGLTNQATNYYVLPEVGTLLAPSDEGIFVAGVSKTLFLLGRDPQAFETKDVLAYGAPLGDPVRVQMSHLGFEGEGIAQVWMSSKGLVAGLPSGMVFNLTDKEVAMAPMVEAAVAFREEMGRRQLLAAGRKSGRPTRLALTDKVVAEIRRNGVVVG